MRDPFEGLRAAAMGSILSCYLAGNSFFENVLLLGGAAARPSSLLSAVRRRAPLDFVVHKEDISRTSQTFCVQPSAKACAGGLHRAVWDTGGFQCTSQSLDGVVCLVLSGDLDLASVTAFRTYLTAAHDADGLILDLRDLRYLDSTGINALFDAHQALAPSGRRIALVGASPNIRRILTILHVEDLMPVFPSVEEALAYVRPNGELYRPVEGV